jgi:ferredoxin
MTHFTIDHDRPGCIGCGACAAVNPQFWVMSPVDGKSDVVGSERQEDGGEIVREKLDIAETDYAKNREAADCCPVNVIHLIDKKTGEKLI